MSDSRNNLVLQLYIETGRIMRVFRNGKPGLVDSVDGWTAQFHTPQCINKQSGKIFIADTEFHVVRAFDLQTGAINTVGAMDIKASITRVRNRKGTSLVIIMGCGIV